MYNKYTHRNAYILVCSVINIIYYRIAYLFLLLYLIIRHIYIIYIILFAYISSSKYEFSKYKKLDFFLMIIFSKEPLSFLCREYNTCKKQLRLVYCGTNDAKIKYPHTCVMAARTPTSSSTYLNRVNNNIALNALEIRVDF